MVIKTHSQCPLVHLEWSPMGWPEKEALQMTYQGGSSMRIMGKFRVTVMAVVIAVTGVAMGAGAHFHGANTAPTRHALAGDLMPPVPLTSSTRN